MPHSLTPLPSSALAMTDIGHVLIVGDEPVQPCLLRTVLEATRGNELKAASILGIDRSTPHRKLKRIQGTAALPFPS